VHPNALTNADVVRLDAFDQRSLRSLLGISWQNHITNIEVWERTGIPAVSETISQRRLSMLGHVSRMPPSFDNFYNLALGLLDKFYPERTTTLRSRDPEYITPYIKSLLRKKNRLMHAGRVEKAGAIACRIRKEIFKGNRTRLQKYNGRVDAKEMWAAVRQLTGRHSQPVTVDSRVTSW